MKRFGRNCVLFRVGDLNDGVFLVLKGKVCLRVPSVTKLDRVFQVGSVLGLPSTFSGNPYSLTAFSVAGCQVIHVARTEFLELMADRSDCCHEAVELLSREAAFIFSAYRDYRSLAFQRTTRTGRPANWNGGPEYVNFYKPADELTKQLVNRTYSGSPHRITVEETRHGDRWAT